MLTLTIQNKSIKYTAFTLFEWIFHSMFDVREQLHQVKPQLQVYANCNHKYKFIHSHSVM